MTISVKLGLVILMLFLISLVDCGPSVYGFTNVRCTVTVPAHDCQGQSTIDYGNVKCECVEGK